MNTKNKFKLIRTLKMTTEEKKELPPIQAEEKASSRSIPSDLDIKNIAKAPEGVPTPAFTVHPEIKIPVSPEPQADILEIGPDSSGLQLPELSPIPGPRTQFSMTQGSISPLGTGNKSPLRARAYDKPKFVFHKL